MLFEFKSRATGTVVMTEAVGKKVLALIGKSPDPQGIITVAQMPDAMRILQQAADRDNALSKAARSAGPTAKPEATDTDDETDDDASIGIGQRVFPLIEMMGEAHKAGKDITWGV
ncbi:MAG: DUF1840 domain-containing protein [Lautropia sp.]